MSEKEPTTKPSDLGLADEPEPPAVPPSDPTSAIPSSEAPSLPSDPLQPPPSTSTSSAPIEVEEQEEETTPTATNPTPPTAPAAPSVEVSHADISEDPEAKRGEVKASFRSASWKSVTPEFTAPLPYQSMIIVEEFEVEGPQWTGKAWQMVTT